MSLSVLTDTSCQAEDEKIFVSIGVFPSSTSSIFLLLLLELFVSQDAIFPSFQLGFAVLHQTVMYLFHLGTAFSDTFSSPR